MVGVAVAFGVNYIEDRAWRLVKVPQLTALEATPD